MANIPVPFPDISAPGIRSQESGGRIINGYLEQLGAVAPQRIVHRRAPGLQFFGTTTHSAPFRGAILIGNTLYAVFADNLVSFTAAGGPAADVGTPHGFAGTRAGFFARNNNNPPDLVFVDPGGTNIAIDTTSGAFTSPISINVASPNSVCAMDGFLVFTLADGHVYASDYNSLNVNALSFGMADARSDVLLRAVPWAGNLFLFGAATTEVWANAGLSPFPFQRTVVIPRGIAGSYCVAGFEDNFSRALIWVADDNTVVRLNGYIPEKISPPDLDGLIENVTDKSKLQMSVFMSRGHAFVALSAVADVDGAWPEWTWIFDCNNDRWTERQSYLRLRSRIDGGVYAFGKWLCGDIASAHLHEISDQAYTEINPDPTQAPQPFRWRLESGPVENFPIGTRVGRADFLFVTGVGRTSAQRTQDVLGVAAAPDGSVRLTLRNTSLMHEGDAVLVSDVGGTVEANGTWTVHIAAPGSVDLIGSSFANAWTSGGTLTELQGLVPIETDPVVEISWSDDGGQNFYAPITRRLGQQAQTRELVSLVACTGRAGWNGRRWRLDIADPVHVGFMGATQAVSARAADALQ